MAVVQDSFTASLSRTVFTKPPDPARQYSALPRALVNFVVNDGTISAKPLNDQQELEIECVLDPKFAYRLVDMSIDLVQDVANDWTSRAYLEITNMVRNLPTGSRQRHTIVLEDTIRVPTAVEMWIAIGSRQDRLPTYILQSHPGGFGPEFDFHATNQVAAAGAAGVVNAFFSFFEYEIEQAEYVALHYSTLTFNR